MIRNVHSIENYISFDLLNDENVSAHITSGSDKEINRFLLHLLETSLVADLAIGLAIIENSSRKHSSKTTIQKSFRRG